MEGNCGIANPANPCRCSRRVGRAVNLGRVEPQRLLFAGHPRRNVRRAVAEMDRLHAAAAIFRSHPEYAAPERLVTEIGRLLDGDALPALAGSDVENEPAATTYSRRRRTGARAKGERA
jgi:hypothetical protein